MKKEKTKRSAGAVVPVEYRRFIRSTVYRTVAGIGPLLALILSVVVLFANIDRILSVIAPGMPVQADSLMPVVPILLFFFIGLAPASLAAWSLEGRSIRISEKKCFRGKILFSLLLQIPPMIIGCICFGTALQVPARIIWMYFLCGAVLCLFSTFYGAFCDLKFIKTDWERESEVFKRRSVILLYIVLNMAMTLTVLAVSFYVGFYHGVLVPLRAVTVAYAGGAALFFILAKRICSRSTEK